MVNEKKIPVKAENASTIKKSIVKAIERFLSMGRNLNPSRKTNSLDPTPPIVKGKTAATDESMKRNRYSQ